MKKVKMPTSPEASRSQIKSEKLKNFLLTRRGIATTAITVVAAAAAIHGPAKSVDIIKHHTLDEVHHVDNPYFSEAGFDGHNISVADLEKLQELEKKEGGKKLAEFKKGLGFLSSLDSETINNLRDTRAKLNFANKLHGAVKSIDRSYYHKVGDYEGDIINLTVSHEALKALSNQGIIFRDKSSTNEGSNMAKDLSIGSRPDVYIEKQSQGNEKVVISFYEATAPPSESAEAYSDQEISQRALLMENMLQARSKEVEAEHRSSPPSETPITLK